MNHLHLTSLLVAPLLSAGLLAQTPVGGPIFSDTTWTLAGSPYDVVQHIAVGNGASLTIDAGVVVRVETGKRITVGAVGTGALLARGTASQPIRFTSKTGTPGDWDCVHFSDGAVDATLVSEAYVSGSILEHCIVEHAGGGTALGAVTILNSAPFLHACRIVDNTASGIYANLADGPAGPTPAMRIEGCVVRRNSYTGGIHLFGGGGHTVTRSTIAGNQAIGINLAADDATISDNVIADNTAGSGVVANGDNILITRNQIVRNQNGIGAGIQVANGSYTITDNLIAHNTTPGAGGGIYIAENQFAQSVSIVDNTIANNTSAQGGGIWKARRSGSWFNSLWVSGNTIANNSVIGVGGGIFLNASTASLHDNTIVNNHAGTDGGGLWNTGQPNLSENTFAGNTAGMGGGGIYTSSLPTAFAGDPINNAFNTMLDNSAPKGDAIYNAMRFSVAGTSNIDATFVCWGPNDPNLQANRIWDFFDDPNLGIVDTTNRVVCDPFASLGAGVPGAIGTPTLTGTGPLTRGSALTVSLENAASLAPAVMMIDAAPTFAYVPILEAIIIPLTRPVVLPLLTDATGRTAIHRGALSDQLPSGVNLYFQCLVMDATARNGLLTVSNGLLGITQ